MRKLIYILVITTLTLFNTISSAYNSDPSIFISELMNDTNNILRDKNISKINKNKKIEDIALENVDINALGMYTLGNIRKTLDEDTLKKYKNLFEKYFLKNLTSRLSEYSENNLEIVSADQKSETYTIVNSKILKTSSQPEVNISWRIYTKDPTKPIIRDLIVEGLSLAKTQKEEFASILNSNNNDINVLFSKLQEYIDN